MARRQGPWALLKCIATMSCLLLVACGGGGGSSSCSIEGQNRFVHENMLEAYYWFKKLPSRINYERFDSPQQSLDFLRYANLDRFS